ncbi:SGNH/GDSL hydrolase family protein [Nitrospira sp. Nam74]
MHCLIPEIKPKSSEVIIPDQGKRLKDWRHKSFLVAVAFIISFCLGEGIVRWWDIIDPPAFEANPYYGYLMRPNQSVSPRGYRFQINNVGFRGQKFAVPKPESTFRTAFLGDSITYGGGEVSDHALFVNRFVQLLQNEEGLKAESVNLSAPGWGIQNMVAYIGENGLYQSDCLVWVISSADFRRPKMSLEENGFWENKPSSRLIYGGSVILRRAYSVVLKRMSQSKTAEARSTSETLEKNLELVKTTLAGLKESGIVSFVVVVPDSNGYDGYDGCREDFQKYKSIVDGLSIPFLDLNPILQQHKTEHLFFDGVHLTSRGHELAAEAIVSFFRANGPRHNRGIS